MVSVHCSPPLDGGVLDSGACSTPCTTTQGRWILAATILGTSMAFVDSTAVNVALPAIQQDLTATVSQLQWVVEAYALLLAALILVGGALGDRLGRRRVFASGIGIFALGSLWAGLSPDATQLIIARGVQGLGGALMVPKTEVTIAGTCVPRVGPGRRRVLGRSGEAALQFDAGRATSARSSSPPI